MFSTRLVAMIEDHAEQLTVGLIGELQRHPRTSGYHHFSASELHDRTYDVYRNLGKWVTRGWRRQRCRTSGRSERDRSPGMYLADDCRSESRHASGGPQ